MIKLSEIINLVKNQEVRMKLYKPEFASHMVMTTKQLSNLTHMSKLDALTIQRIGLISGVDYVVIKKRDAPELFDKFAAKMASSLAIYFESAIWKVILHSEKSECISLKEKICSDLLSVNRTILMSTDNTLIPIKKLLNNQ